MIYEAVKDARQRLDCIWGHDKESHCRVCGGCVECPVEADGCQCVGLSGETFFESVTG